MNSTDLPVYIIGYIIAFVIAVFVTRAIFSIPKFLKIQRAQLQILAEIALKQGVKSEILRSIHVENELELRGKTNEEIRAEREAANIAKSSIVSVNYI